MATPEAFVPVAVTSRSGFDESVHFGAVVAIGADGDVVFACGDPTVAIYPRSASKPMQAMGMVRLGLDLPPDQLAVACASHDGTPYHLDLVRGILSHAGLNPSMLANTPDLPIDPASSAAVVRAGGGSSPLQQNCSGKHAAMLATCVLHGWPTDHTYVSPDHPLQRAITRTIASVTGEQPSAIGIDGCGAPAHVMTLLGLARGFQTIAGRHGEPAARRIASAMSEYPLAVGGQHRDVTTFMRMIPGLVAKDGAEGIFAAGLPDGRAVAVKIADGGDRARPVVMLAAMRAIGIDVDALAPMVARAILGHGHPVGEVRSLVR